jgi:uncharacterized membrane protein
MKKSNGVLWVGMMFIILGILVLLAAALASSYYPTITGEPVMPSAQWCTTTTTIQPSWIPSAQVAGIVLVLYGLTLCYLSTYIKD